MTEKRLTAAELKAQQEEREKAARDAERATEEAADRRRQDAAQAALLANVEMVKASWYKSVESAARRDGVRFVVVAEISNARSPALDDLMQAIKQDGYECVVTTVKAAQVYGRGTVQLPGNNEEGAVESGNLRGWKPSGIPRLGSSGSSQYLIIKWA